jgi:hypothetical protein
MLENFTNQTFETTKKPIMVEVMTYSGSAFAATIDGEQVFINQRIVQSLNLQEGMTLLAHLLPNYVDKRDTIPWRAMRVEPLDGTEVQGPRIPVSGSLISLRTTLMRTSPRWIWLRSWAWRRRR